MIQSGRLRSNRYAFICVLRSHKAPSSVPPPVTLLLDSETMLLVVELAVWLFWWTVFHGYQAVLSLFFHMIPLSALKAELMKQFEAGGIKFASSEEDAGKYDKTKYKCEVVVHNDGFFRRAAIEDSLGMGEAYMDGW